MVETQKNALRDFVAYVRNHLEGDEKGEAQVFLEKLIVAFGNAGHKEAGAKLEFRVKEKGQATKFADLLWGDRVLIEMKKRGEKLEKHRYQATEYWLKLIPHPKFVVLCNFDEFWIYDFNVLIEEPVDKIHLEQLPERYSAMAFLLPTWTPSQKIVFQNNLLDVTRQAADYVARVYTRLIKRGIEHKQAQLFILQCVFAFFAEDIHLLEPESFTKLLLECRDEGASSYDLLGGLFRQMNQRKQATGGRYKSVTHFNGGLFAKEAPIDFDKEELDLLVMAASENWSKVQPAIFGAIFEESLGKGERHALGAHYTREVDILKVVVPTIIEPWEKRIRQAGTLKELVALKEELSSFRVLDPACGSGNFLYVAYRALKRLESDLNLRIYTEFSGKAAQLSGRISQISTSQFYGMDINAFAVDLAKVTMVIAKKLAIDESQLVLDNQQLLLPIQWDQALPLDNLDNNIVCADAIFDEWQQVDAIIGNPPYQGKKNLKRVLGIPYVERLRRKFPTSTVSGRADYCVFWFRMAHENLPKNGRAGLIGTNHIRRTYSRKAGLDYIVDNGGTITEAVASQVWPGDADVHVSIVNWIKGKQEGKKKIRIQHGDRVDAPFTEDEVDVITGGLSADFDAGGALALNANCKTKIFYQGQTHGNAGFLLTPEQALTISRDKSSKGVIHPYLVGLDLLRRTGSLPSRYVIDLNHCDDVVSASAHRAAFEHLKIHVMPDMKEAAEKELAETGKHGDRQRHFTRWWKFWRARKELMDLLSSSSRYIVFSRHMKRPIAEFIDPAIHPNDALQVFTAEDDYSFGILQSSSHAAWFKQRGGTLTARARMTPEMGFVTFPWPQKANSAHIRAVANASRDLRVLRRKLMRENNWSFRNLYETLDVPGKNTLMDAHNLLDQSVREAYGMKKESDGLEFLVKLNAELKTIESSGGAVIGPGLPPSVEGANEFISGDAVKMPEFMIEPYSLVAEGT